MSVFTITLFGCTVIMGETDDVAIASGPDINAVRPSPPTSMAAARGILPNLVMVSMVREV